MSQQKFGWMLALMVAWRQLSRTSNPEDDDGLQVERIEAIAGRLARPSSNAANDQKAALLILVLIWYLSCAKYRAKVGESSALSRKLFGRRFDPVILREPACLRLFPVFALILALCQNDRLPTATVPQ